MKAIICVLATLITSTALAYKDGTYNCKIGDGSIPDRVVRIETISLANGSAAVPFIEVTRSYKEGNQIKTNEVKGFATVHKTGDNETLMLAALRFDFVNDVLQNCNK
jgi:hypothetical protein